MPGEDVAVEDRSEAMHTPGWEGATEHVDLGGEQFVDRGGDQGLERSCRARCAIAVAVAASGVRVEDG